MNYDFENPPPRQGTDSQKWQKYAGRDVLPMWVADMDFQSAPEIIAALHARVDHGIFGYARPKRSTIDSVVEHLARRSNWQIDPAWIVWLPGLVVGLNVTSRAFAGPGKSVLINTPVYPPFSSAPKNAGSDVIAVPLVRENSSGLWQMDFAAMERAVTPETKLFLLCNPHNPVGRVFTRNELERLAEFCLKHDLILCADEIHSDLILDPAQPHIAAGSISPEIASRTITLHAPSKTYNLPGFSTAFAIIPDAKLRARFIQACAGIVAEAPALGFTACEAAFRHGEPWRLALLTHLRNNRDYLIRAIDRELPGVFMAAKIEATYLAWLDIKALNIADPIAHFEKFGVGLSDGRAFGEGGQGHVRLNFGCTRSTLEEAVRRIKAALRAQ